MNYTTVESILSKVFRDLGLDSLNESDAIERIGEALEFLKVPQIQEQSVILLPVEEHRAEVPVGFHAVLQLARLSDKVDIPCTHKNPKKTDCGCEPCSSTEDCLEELNNLLELEENKSYHNWVNCDIFQNNFKPIRLSNKTFFNSLVCQEKNYHLYTKSCEDEYTISGTIDKEFRFSFRNGVVALSYLKNALDPTTGYPLVPDEISFITAITYYLKWKLAEEYTWKGREGFARLAADSERLWLKYCKQAQNNAMMPKTIDQYQNLLEQSHNMIPNHRLYYGFFGRLGRADKLKV